MATVRGQILAEVERKLEGLVAISGNYNTFERNPREPIETEDMGAIVMFDGGDQEPQGLSGNVDDQILEFSVMAMVVEGAADGDPRAEDLLDQALEDITDTLIDPADIQLGGRAVDIRRGGITDPVIGRAVNGAETVGGQMIDFMVRYMAVEGDASAIAP